MRKHPTSTGSDMQSGENLLPNEARLIVELYHRNDLETLKSVSDPRKLIACRDHDGWTLLFMAAKDGHIDFARFLLQYGADPNEAARCGYLEGQTPLMQCATSGNLAMCELLLSNGADADALDINRIGALQLACRHGHIDVVRLLLARGAQINAAIDADGRTDRRSAIGSAASAGALDIVDLLLDHGAALTTGADEDPVLLRAVDSGAIEIVRRFLDKSAPVDARDFRGDTPLMRAASNGNCDLATLLLDSGADPNKTNDEGWTALMMAAEAGHGEVASLLLASGGNAELKNSDGKTARDIAIENGQIDFLPPLA